MATNRTPAPSTPAQYTQYPQPTQSGSRVQTRSAGQDSAHEAFEALVEQGQVVFDGFSGFKEKEEIRLDLQAISEDLARHQKKLELLEMEKRKIEDDIKSTTKMKEIMLRQYKVTDILEKMFGPGRKNGHPQFRAIMKILLPGLTQCQVQTMIKKGPSATHVARGVFNKARATFELAVSHRLEHDKSNPDAIPDPPQI